MNENSDFEVVYYWCTTTYCSSKQGGAARSSTIPFVRSCFWCSQMGGGTGASTVVDRFFSCCFNFLKNMLVLTGLVKKKGATARRVKNDGAPTARRGAARALLVA